MQRTLERLWALYREARREFEAAGGGPKAERVEREIRHLKNRLVVNYSPLVKYAVGRVSARMTGNVDQEDLISWGIVGLLDAVETFDAGKGAKFETYAISKIRWSILDELRRLDPLPRRVRQRVREVQRAREELEQKLRRSPTEAEVAERLGVDLREHYEFLERYRRSQTWSLEASVEGAEEPGWGLHQVIADSASESPEVEAEAGETKRRLVEAIKELGERERVVTTFYYYEGLTLREIGKALGLTEGRISQILKQATKKLRRALGENGPLPFG